MAAVAMLQGAAAAFSWNLDCSPTTQLRVSYVVPARQKIPLRALPWKGLAVIVLMEYLPVAH